MQACETHLQAWVIIIFVFLEAMREAMKQPGVRVVPLVFRQCRARNFIFNDSYGALSGLQFSTIGTLSRD